MKNNDKDQIIEFLKNRIAHIGRMAHMASEELRKEDVDRRDRDDDDTEWIELGTACNPYDEIEDYCDKTIAEVTF